jgi:hypothetical protein
MQAAPQNYNKEFYGTSDAGEDPDLDRRIDLCARGHPAKAAGAGSQTLQILSVTLFEKTPILQALQTFDIDDNLLQDANQLILFNP